MQTFTYADDTWTAPNGRMALVRRILRARASEGVLSPETMLKLFPSEPRLHTFTARDSALRAAGCERE